MSNFFYYLPVKFSEYKAKVGRNVKQLRLEQGLTQEDMDEGENSIPYRTIQNLEAGKSNPSLKTIFRISKRLNVSTCKILDV